LQTGGAGYLTGRPNVAAWVEGLATAPPLFVVDEYVERDLMPTSHAQIAGDMLEHGCTYVGSAQLMDDVGLDVPDAVADLIAAAPSRTLRESYGDLAVRRTSRTDLFRLGSAPVPRADENTTLAALQLTGTRALHSTHAVSVPDGLLDALEQRTLSAAELDSDPDCARLLVRQLLDGGFAHPSSCDAGRADAEQAVERLNRAMSQSPDRAHVVALATIGSAIPSDLASRDRNGS
jgi:hypothetical protein